MTRRISAVRLVAIALLIGSALAAQAATQSKTSLPSTGYSGLDEYRASRIAIYTDDFGELRRYRDADTALAPPAAKENRVIFLGDSITDYWKLADYFPGKPLHQSRHRRADHAADAGALPPGCD